MHSLLAIDANHRPLTAGIIWSDTRSKTITNEYRKDVDLYLRTGTPIYPMSPLFKIMWIKKNEPEVFKNTFKFISIKEYIILKLCGELVVDLSMASAYGLFNINLMNWDVQALELAGITPFQLSELKPINYCIP